jgi:hypothetical protein
VFFYCSPWRFWPAGCVLPPIFRMIARLPELVLVGAIAWCFAMAGFASYLNLSSAIGALVAGVMISTFPYTLDIVARVTSLRDFFVTLFFVSLGMAIPLPTWKRNFVDAVFLSLPDRQPVYHRFSGLVFPAAGLPGERAIHDQPLSGQRAFPGPARPWAKAAAMSPRTSSALLPWPLPAGDRFHLRHPGQQPALENLLALAE